MKRIKKVALNLKKKSKKKTPQNKKPRKINTDTQKENSKMLPQLHSLLTKEK